MRATRLIYKLRNKSYEERLRTLDLPTLKYRRLKGDMIETYKTLSGKYDVSVSPVIPLVSDTVTSSNTRYVIVEHIMTRESTLWSTFTYAVRLLCLCEIVPLKSYLGGQNIRQEIGKVIGKMWNCGMRNVESKMRNPKIRKCLQNGG